MYHCALLGQIASRGASARLMREATATTAASREADEGQHARSEHGGHDREQLACNRDGELVGWEPGLILSSCLPLEGLAWKVSTFRTGMTPKSGVSTREVGLFFLCGFERCGWLYGLRLSLACAGELVGFGVVPIVTSQHEPQVRTGGMGPDRVAPVARPAAKPAPSQEGFERSHFHTCSIALHAAR